jgi:drug/metabolite transporter (DMT)-like permease
VLKLKKQYKGLTMAFTSAICFSFLPIFAVYAYNYGLNVNTLLLLRFTIASLFFFFYILIKYKKINIDKSSLFKLFLLGGIMYTLQATCFFMAVKYISPSLTSLLLYLYPIFVAVLSAVIDKEKLGKSIILSIGVSFVSLILVLGTALGSINLYGVFFGIATAIIYSIYIVMGNRVVKDVPPIVTTFFVCFFASISFLAAGLVTGDLKFGFEPAGYIAVTAISAFPTIISLLTFFKSLELIGSTKSSILSMIEPVSTILLSAFLFGERLSLLQLLGATGVLFGAYMVVVSQRKENASSQKAKAL